MGVQGLCHLYHGPEDITITLCWNFGNKRENIEVVLLVMAEREKQNKCGVNALNTNHTTAMIVNMKMYLKHIVFMVSSRNYLCISIIKYPLIQIHLVL